MIRTLTTVAAAVLITACASGPQLAPPAALKAPEPIVGNTGKFMSPFTEDGTVAPWVEKGRNASAGANVGGFIGAQAGAKLTENIPFVGGLLGQKIGESAGRSIALKMVGGEEYIKSTSDLSFDTVNDMAVYMYVKNSSHKDYAAVLDLTQKIYPELRQAYMPAIYAASSTTAR
jgi:hypothetical protein